MTREAFMHTLIARLTVLSTLSFSAYAEVPQFPDASMLPPDTSATSGSVSTTNTTTGNSAAGIYVYPQADTTSNIGNNTAVSPTATTYGYTYPPSQTNSGWGNYYNYAQPSYYNPSQYFLPSPMLTPPSTPPMMMPTIPSFSWPNMGFGYRNNTTPYSNWPGNAANTQMPVPPATTPAIAPNTQQIDALNQNLSNLRQQQTDLENKTQQTLSAHEQTIADLRKQLETASQVKGDLESQLTALRGELAESVKKAELESCKAEKDELAGKVSDMDQKVSAIAEVSQQFAQLRQNFATLETEKQQLVSALEHETKDLDADGVPDKLDKCPESALGVTVDASGCKPPKDTDKDGVTDEKDRCPVTAEGVKVDDNGCDLPPPPPPDGDKDGIIDANDQCLDTKEGVKIDDKGCDLPLPPPADGDKDSIPDDADKCLDTKEGTKIDDTGCDAIADADNDGVADDADLCADTAADAEVNQVGCSKTENINLKGVTFETGSAVLTATSFPILDEAAATLKKYPDLKIEVGGHTDSSGDKTANEKLSQSRAEAVMNYLTDKGVAVKFLSAKGYWLQHPIADNATPDGKAQNRRVELKILGQ